MYEHRFEVIGWLVAIVVVGAMGLLVLHGPFHSINRVAAKSNFPPLKVQIVSDARTIGRYSPNFATAHVGQSIIFTNVSNAPHTVTARQGNTFSSPLIQTGGGTYTLVVTKPGVYAYYCTVHPDMLATLRIKS